MCHAGDQLQEALHWGEVQQAGEHLSLETGASSAGDWAGRLQQQQGPDLPETAAELCPGITAPRPESTGD